MLLNKLRPHRGFLVLLLLFTLGVLAEHAVLPVMEGGDEYLHYNYVQYLLRENRLPDRATYLTNTMQQQSGQPPLVYWTAALLMRLANVAPDDDAALWQRFSTHKNPWYAAPDQWNRVDNRNLFFHGGGHQAFETPTIERVDRLIRFTGLIFGLLAIIGAYAASREVFGHSSWALTAAAIFAFTPQLIHVASFTNTDSGMIAFAALATWAALRLLRLGASPGRLLLIGTLLALAALSKVSALLIAPGIGLAVLLDGYRRRLSVWRILVNGLLLGIPLLLLFAPWVLYGLTTYNDPIGTKTHLRPGYYYDQPLTVAQFLPLLPEIYLGYWGKLASAIYLHPLTYTALGTILVLSISGYALRLITKALSINSVSEGMEAATRLLLHPPSLLAAPASFRAEGGIVGEVGTDLRTHQFLVLSLVILVSLAGLIHWLQTIQFITGRLMFQAHAAVAIAITAGLYLLARQLPSLARAIQLYALGIVVVAGVLLTPVSIHTAYAPPPMLTAEGLPSLQGNPVDFSGTLRFLGFAQDTPILSGSAHTLTLCWQVLQSTQRPAAFSIKIVHDGNIIADRTSVHGLGRYDSGQWQPGDRWCDTVRIPIFTPPEPGQTYDLLLVLLDARTQAVDWAAAAPDGTSIQYPFIGQVSAPPE